MSDYYDTMQVCSKCGNQITAYYDTSPEHRQKRCDKCGGITIFKCPKCSTKIRGKYHMDGAIDLTKKEVPWSCHECGSSYPWRNWFVLKTIGRGLVSPIKYAFDSVIRVVKK